MQPDWALLKANSGSVAEVFPGLTLAAALSQNTCCAGSALVFDRGPEERRQQFELSTQSPQDSPLLQDTPKTSRPKDEGKRKEQEEKQKLEKETKKGQRKWEN